MRTLVCRHCGRTILTNKKLKHLLQQYCGDKTCQTGRKLRFERHKYKTNSAFRSAKLQRVRDRRKTLLREGKPFFGSQYQSSYRSSHPEYVLENRLRQRERNTRKRRKSKDDCKIVNPDTLIAKQIDNDMVYAMIAVDYQKIVNPDAFMSQLAGMESITKAQTMFVRRL
jgi:hypothetical protein